MPFKIRNNYSSNSSQITTTTTTHRKKKNSKNYLIKTRVSSIVQQQESNIVTLKKNKPKPAEYAHVKTKTTICDNRNNNNNNNLTLKQRLQNSFYLDLFSNVLIFCIPAKIIESSLKLFNRMNCDTRLVMYGFLAIVINETKHNMDGCLNKFKWIMRLFIILKAVEILYKIVNIKNNPKK